MMDAILINWKGIYQQGYDVPIDLVIRNVPIKLSVRKDSLGGYTYKGIAN